MSAIRRDSSDPNLSGLRPRRGPDIKPLLLLSLWGVEERNTILLPLNEGEIERGWSGRHNYS